MSSGDCFSGLEHTQKDLIESVLYLLTQCQVGVVKEVVLRGDKLPQHVQDHVDFDPATDSDSSDTNQLHTAYSNVYKVIKPYLV